ncbi:c-type cytochrome biogenesis protein CcmI [Falsochrobactrum ovis]|uniref:Cytochrome c-type biogenesis protein CcmH n=1 Tax=Falsochrobactrum ovis TaxID=1293442 RepID=A0A364K0I1_9HYPH|nr:c-type cytochrome biogenesis protein CcmI [Falsochrobactrum ovis]RAK34381.1 cytochrome c-type biogenesis protein CcmH [Falsochrobactrum ovis]
MEFWFFAILLTIAATLIVLLPLTRSSKGFLPARKNDLEVYRDQLREVDADLARGMIDEASAEQARIEISRRILAAEKASDDSASIYERRSGHILSFAAVLCVPLIAWGVYPFFGKPDMPSMPLSSRLQSAAGQNSVEELIARAEAHLAQNPNDARGWDVLAPIYLRLGRAADAANAYRAAIRIDGENVARNLGLGEALITISGGTITAEAETFFQKAAKLAPDNIGPQFYLAQGELQDGRAEAAVTRLQTFLKKPNVDASTRAQVEELIARLRSQPQTLPGPTSEEIEAASQLSAEDQQAMIEGMVERLDARLRENGADLDGWKRLLRSYLIIDRREAANDALKRGLSALKGEEQVELQLYAAQLGLESGSRKE